MRLSAAGAEDRRGPARRRTTAVVVCAAVVTAGIATGPGVAVAQESPTPSPSTAPSEIYIPEPVPGESVCEITDPRLTEISGMVATEDGYIVINDSQDFGFEDRLPIFFLDENCQVVDQQPFLIGRPLDPEDMEYDPESQTLWIGDIGDNAAGDLGEGEPRITVALWRVDLSGGDRTPVIHRFVYPDGQARDAETLLLDGDGTPIIVTKSVGPAELYVPTDLVPNNPPEQGVPLEKVGEFDPPDTGTPNRFQGPGRKTITGGAVSPDRSTVVLRTYADAFEFDVVDGDVAAAITGGEPRVTPLPDEPQGEAITYTPDGSQFLTVSEVAELESVLPEILRYTPSVPPEPTTPPAESGPSASEDSGFSLFNNVQDIINLIIAVGVVGLILVGIGVFGIVRARRRRAANDDSEPAAPVTGRANLYGASASAGASGSPAAPGSPSGPAAPDPAQEQGWEPGAGQPSGVYTSRAAGGGEYLAGSPAAGAEQPPDTGHAGGQYAGGEYGGGQYAGGEYAGTQYGGGTHPGNVYGGNEYQGNQYQGNQYQGGEYQGGEYAGNQYQGNEYQGNEYGGGQYAGSEYAGNEYQGNQYQGGEYAGTQYQGNEYQGNEYGGGQYAGSEYAGNEYQGNQYQGNEYAGNQYGGEGYGGGYGGAEYGGQYAGGGYDQQGYGGQYGEAGGYPAQGQGVPQQPYPDQGHQPGYGGESAGTYQSGGQPDYYSEDPDYPYEFRGQGRW